MLGYIPKYLTRGLFQLIFYPTFRCNARCLTCFNWKNIESAKKDELSIEEINRISKNMPSFPWLMFSGGEPFLRNDLDEIAYIFYKNNRIRHLSIPTNALLPETIKKKTESILEKCRKISFNLVLSLDNIGSKDDKIRGVKGCFKKTMETYKLVSPLRKKYKNFAIKFNTVITNENYKEIDKIADYVKKLKPDMHSFDLIRGDPRDKSLKLPPESQLAAIAGKIKKIYDYYGGYKSLSVHYNYLSRLSKKIMKDNLDLTLGIVKQKKQLIPCYAGRVNAVIYPYGDVAFCEILKPFAGLRDFNYDFKKLWSSKKAKELRKFIKSKKCFCYHPCYQETNLLFDYKYILKKALGK